MAKKTTITNVPKAIRTDVKSFLKHGNDGKFQLVLVFVDNTTGNVGMAANASRGLARLIEQAASNYADITSAVHASFHAGQDSIQKAA